MAERVAYKFLDAAGLGRFSRFAWPLPQGELPGRWVRADGPLVPCEKGIHACASGQLPLWLDDELWAMELGGDLVELSEFVVARRGRLIARVQGWTAETARAFACACADRARAHAAAGDGRAAEYAEDAVSFAADCAGAQDAALAALAAAHATEAVPAGSLSAEREWQADWLADRLGLPDRTVH